ncbi:hypothetical protein [Micromonospora sp. KC207]|uniref:hypothetical protein n=1 Tax=Micromonospora sp. KC207 TaxID=2530377 RepID=UPI001FB5B27B|nr:hypothetical protein [Micromonospora sp. KC207]
MNAPSKVSSTRYAPVNGGAGGAGWAGEAGGDAERLPPLGLETGLVGRAVVGDGDERGDRPGTTGAGDSVTDRLTVGGSVGSGIVGCGIVHSGAGNASPTGPRVRYVPSATNSNTTITTTPTETTIQGELAMAVLAPEVGRTRRVPDMSLLSVPPGERSDQQQGRKEPEHH